MGSCWTRFLRTSAALHLLWKIRAKNADNRKIEVICYIDGGTYLENKEWEDVLAWAEMPKGESEKDDG